ncbi:MAG: hypothetical protein KatS3mg101_1154 [Patescibacteria group bacterium]|nr:MAG: hypothetical protein KatS3mg101_1154 [Patescibacteria group bacterium]
MRTLTTLFVLCGLGALAYLVFKEYKKNKDITPAEITDKVKSFIKPSVSSKYKPCSYPLKKGCIHEDIKELQSLLKNKGWNPGPVDGIWGDQTDKALKTAYERSGLPFVIPYPDEFISKEQMLSIIKRFKNNE